MKTHSKRTLSIAPLAVLLFLACNKDGLTHKEEKQLFATPVQTETDAILAEWQSRDLTPTDYTVLQQTPVAGGQYTFKMVGFRVSGIQEYGALLVPQASGTMPVRMQLGGFGLGITVNSFNLLLGGGAPSDPHILAMPAFRGQSLEVTVDGVLYTSPQSGGEHCDAFDGATDDALAFLNLIQQTEPTADVNRTSMRGGSRGGTVSLLAGIRDPRVKRVVDVVGPTDMLVLTSQHLLDDTYRCQFLTALQNDQVTLAQARKRIIASSPLYFAQRLPLVQLHMGVKDPNVPIDQGYALESEMLRLGLSHKFQLFIYDKAHTDIAIDNPEMVNRIEQFLSQL